MTLQSLRTIHPKAGVIISGDRNDLCIQKLLNIDASLKQTVLHPTRGTKILTVILTDLQDFYNDPIIVPPVSVDNPQTGVPSDHMGVVYIPINTVDEVANKQKVTRTIRPITDAGIRNIGQVFTHEKWEFLDPSLSPSTLTSLFTSYTKDIINNFCPEKTIVERPGSNPFMTEDMKVLKRKTMREYEKRGKSSKYLELRTNLDQKIKKEKLKYKDKVLEQVFNGTRSSSYAAIRRLGERPGDACAGSSFILPEHADLNLGSEQAVELIANHFAAISKEFSPIDLNNFSPKLRKALAAPDWSVVPKLTEYQVYKRICKAKKPNSSVPDDLPKKIVQEFAVELAAPVTVIFNSILANLQFPCQWLVEYQVPLPKVNPPTTLDELRNISKTAFFSKCFESFLADWLLPIVAPYIDPCQFGLKGSSVSHFLLQLLLATDTLMNV